MHMQARAQCWKAQTIFCQGLKASTSIDFKSWQPSACKRTSHKSSHFFVHWNCSTSTWLYQKEDLNFTAHGNVLNYNQAGCQVIRIKHLTLCLEIIIIHGFRFKWSLSKIEIRAKSSKLPCSVYLEEHMFCYNWNYFKYVFRLQKSISMGG